MLCYFYPITILFFETAFNFSKKYRQKKNKRIKGGGGGEITKQTAKIKTNTKQQKMKNQRKKGKKATRAQGRLIIFSRLFLGHLLRKLGSITVIRSFCTFRSI